MHAMLCYTIQIFSTSFGFAMRSSCLPITFFLLIYFTTDPSGWWQGRVGDREGLFPANYVEEVSEA